MARIYSIPPKAASDRDPVDLWMQQPNGRGHRTPASNRPPAAIPSAASSRRPSTCQDTLIRRLSCLRLAGQRRDRSRAGRPADGRTGPRQWAGAAATAPGLALVVNPRDPPARPAAAAPDAEVASAQISVRTAPRPGTKPGTGSVQRALPPCRPCRRQPNAAASADRRHGAEARTLPRSAAETSGAS